MADSKKSDSRTFSINGQPVSDDAELIRILEQSRPREQRRELTPEERAERRRLVSVARKEAATIAAANRAKRLKATGSLCEQSDPSDSEADFLAWAKDQTGCDDETWEKAREQTRGQVKRRPVHKAELHALIRKFVATYVATADPENRDGDLEQSEREDLARGARLKTSLREKWAITRVAEYFGRDERTIREAVNPSRRSRCRI
jgi:hypothetical protein